MNWQTFLDELAQEGIMLWPDGDNLAFEDPYYALTTDRLQTLKTHKHDLLHFLFGWFKYEDSVTIENL